METAAKPVLNIVINLEIEVEYDPFSGRTQQQFSESLLDDLHDSLLDFREKDVQALFSSVVSVQEYPA